MPRIVIIGRPNVGKSTLLNRILKKKRAIIHDEPGVTRDISEYPFAWKGKEVYLVDTGGVFFAKTNDIYLQEEVEKHVMKAIETASRIIFVTDVTAGVHPQDEHIANIIRPFKQKVLLAVNKADNSKREIEASTFFKLGLGEPIAISSLLGQGVQSLLDTAFKGISSEKTMLHRMEQAYKIAIVGRPNVGKSSLTNALINEDKMIVDGIAGTTRDAVEVFFEYQNNKYIFVDTAGIRKKGKKASGVEYFSILRSSRSIREADLAIMVIDTPTFLCDQDKKIINHIYELNTNILIFVNKWDLTSRTSQERTDLIHIAHSDLPFLKYVPFIFGSATERVNIGKIFTEAPKVLESSEIRVSTSELNQFIQNVIRRNPPPAKYGKHVKIYYGTQPESNPPGFVFFVNHPKFIQADYYRFLEKRLRDHLGGFIGNPIRIHFRKHR